MGKKKVKDDDDDDDWKPEWDDFPPPPPPTPEGGWKNPERMHYDISGDPEGGYHPPMEDDPLDIRRLDLRVGKIIFAMVHPNKPESQVLTYVNVGDPFPRPIVSEIGRNYTKRDLEERMVIAMCNLEPMEEKNISNTAMLMCATRTDRDGVAQHELWNPPAKSHVGEEVRCEDYPLLPHLTHSPHRPFMRREDKIYDQVVVDLRVNGEKEIVYKDKHRLFVKGRNGFINTTTFADCNIKTNPV